MVDAGYLRRAFEHFERREGRVRFVVTSNDFEWTLRNLPAGMTSLFFIHVYCFNATNKYTVHKTRNKATGLNKKGTKSLKRLKPMSNSYSATVGKLIKKHPNKNNVA